MNDSLAEDRWEEFLRVCIAAGENERFLTERDVEFANSQAERLAQYEHRTFITVGQINWIHRIEQTLRDNGVTP